MGGVSENGTDAYEGLPGLPPLVEAALGLARSLGFPCSCLPEHGELLRLLARGVKGHGVNGYGMDGHGPNGHGVIGETGTGCGVGLAWLLAGARPGSSVVSIERDPERAAAVQKVFADVPGATVRNGDWHELQEFAPFDLLVLDGGGQGKGGEPPLEPDQWMRTGGVLVVDDFSPLTSWPPMHGGAIDTARTYWLDHPQLRATQVNVRPDAATIIAAYVGRHTAG